jgi:VWFA-related protein
MCLSAAAAQTPSPPVARDQTVLRIAVDLVQVDATVTDRRGRHVADLSAADFEILQDGRPQKISTFAYVDAGSAIGKASLSPVAPRLGPSPPLKADEVRRTIALVVDDLGLSFESTARIRDVLRRFIDTHLQPGDLVAILRTGAGMGALQQFTSDRRQLQASVEGIRWNMLTRVSPFQPIAEEDRTIDEIRREHFSAGTLGAIRYVVRGIADLPGRKSVILLSDGFQMTDASFGSGSGGRTYGRVFDALRSLVDAANRAGVVIYSIDARGLAITSPGAAHGSPPSPEASGALEAANREELRDTQDGLGFLAHETGGLFMRNTNDIGGGIQRAVEDQRSYYLLGYVPDGGTFGAARPKFHSLRVRVKRPGLSVRSRSGFFGVPDKTAPSQTPQNRMIAAVTSPFAGGSLRMRLSSFFSVDEKIGPVMFSVMHVDARDIRFTEQADGSYSTDLETLAVTFGENGQIADQNSRRHSITLKPDAHKQVLERGFVYRVIVPLKQPGPYQLRVALRDVGADRIGSASQFVEVPNLKKGRLTLSGLAIEGATPRMLSQRASDTDVDEREPGATLALRTFRQGTAASYVSFVYNAGKGRDGQAQLDASTRLYRDGREVFRSEPRPVVPVPGVRAPVATGVLQLGANMPPGSYVLEIAVVDKLAKKHARATQMIDFDVIP